MHRKTIQTKQILTQKPKRRTKLIVFSIATLGLIIIVGILTSLLVMHHEHKVAVKANSSTTSSLLNKLGLKTSGFTYSDAYSYPLPATTKLAYGHKYIANGIQYELDSELPFPGGAPCTTSTPSTQVCYQVANGAVTGFVYGCPQGDTCILDSNTKLLDMKLTNVSGQNIDYTSCFESDSTCTQDEATNQLNIDNSINFGCIAQLTGANKTYETITNDQNVYDDGGFEGDPLYPQFDPTQLPDQLTLAQAITTFTNNGTGSYSLQPVTIKFNVGETKTAQFEVDGQCVAVGAPDKSVFWPIH